VQWQGSGVPVVIRDVACSCFSVRSETLRLSPVSSLAFSQALTAHLCSPVPARLRAAQPHLGKEGHPATSLFDVTTRCGHCSAPSGGTLVCRGRTCFTVMPVSLALDDWVAPSPLHLESHQKCHPPCGHVVGRCPLCLQGGTLAQPRLACVLAFIV
jgi:hypothetical protein